MDIWQMGPIVNSLILQDAYSSRAVYVPVIMELSLFTTQHIFTFSLKLGTQVQRCKTGPRKSHNYRALTLLTCVIPWVPSPALQKQKLGSLKPIVCTASQWQSYVTFFQL